MSFKSRGATERLILGYGVAVVLVAAAIITLSVMEARWRTSAPVSLFLMAVIVSTLLGGIKPGMLAAALSILGFDYILRHLPGSFAGHAVQLLSLAIVAAYVIWITATERRSNDALRAENTENKRAKEAVSESHQLLQLVLATLPVGVSVVDQKGDIILANAVLKRIWGDPPIVRGAERWAQSVGSWHDSGRRIAPEEWASVRALSNGETSLNELIDIETYDGQPKTIQNSSAPIRSRGGQIVGAVIVNEDVTERVRAAKALQESATRLQRLSHRLLTVQEEERRHLSRELHDEFGQLLASVGLHLHAARGLAGARAQPALDESITLLQQAGAQVRSLALELRPTMLETGGLESALRWLAEQHQQRTGIVTQVVGHVGEVSGDLAIACFRVVQEALTNVVRHAHARNVWIELSQPEGFVELVVRDDGAGFDVTRTLERAASGGNLGLLGMRERVEILGGNLEIESRAGEGTRIRIALPLTETGGALARGTAA